MATFGEFFDEVVNDSEKAEALVLLEEWHECVSLDEWLAYRKVEVDEDMVKTFAEDVSGMFNEVIASTSSPLLLADRIMAAGKLLALIETKAMKFGIEITFNINLPFISNETLLELQQMSRN